jgi:hypothetical protein
MNFPPERSAGAFPTRVWVRQYPAGLGGAQREAEGFLPFLRSEAQVLFPPERSAGAFPTRVWVRQYPAGLGGAQSA